MPNVIFVCLGNICRSPMAEAIFRDKVDKAKMTNQMKVDSAGTGNWHTGMRPHEGTLEILDQYNVDHQSMKARQVGLKDLKEFDYIIAMDAANLGELHRIKGYNESGEISRLLDFVSNSEFEDVPDPYFTGNFMSVYELVEEGCTQLLNYIKQKENI